MSIKFTEAAEFFKKEQHQIDAWNWLQSQISSETLEAFAKKYRCTVGT
jgi:hypothetical protein